MAQSKRISGQEMDSAERTAYSAERDGKWDIDMGVIQARIGEYLKAAEEAGCYSISGLCIALGITRETLRLWRMGYVSVEDEQRARVLPNAELAEAVARAELYVHRYWEECGESKLQSKHTKLLESAGVVGDTPKKSKPVVYDLGSFKKYAK
jgi:hypothetical protein